jgi:hypothetical protein
MKLIPKLIILSTIFALGSVTGRIKGGNKIDCIIIPGLITYIQTIDVSKEEFVPPFIGCYKEITKPYIDKLRNKASKNAEDVHGLCIPNFDKMSEEKEFEQLFIYLFNYRYNYSHFFFNIKFYFPENNEYMIFWLFGLKNDTRGFSENIKSYNNMYTVYLSIMKIYY